MASTCVDVTGELVLAAKVGQWGASNAPRDNRAINCHRVNADTNGHRAGNCCVNASNTANASATGPARPAGTRGSATSRVNNPDNHPRTSSARLGNLRSQSRTVSNGTPNSAAIFVHGRPSAAATSAAPITSTWY